MAQRWIDVSVRVFLSFGLAYCIYLVGTRAVAQWHFRKSTPEGIRQAIRWDPNNAQYYATLAHVIERSPAEADLNEVIRLYETATRLSPHQARYWAELAGTYELGGRGEESEQAYERAQQLFPNSPRINWRLANFYLRSGKVDVALPALQKVLIRDPELRLPTFDLAWRAGASSELILQVMIPSESGIFFQYINYLTRTERLDQASEAWARLLGLGLRFEPKAAFPYLDGLIQNERVDELTAAWAALVERNPTQIRRRPFDPNLITNGDFESEILNGGLAWRGRPVEGVVVSVDTLTFFDGSRSLRIAFDGKHNLDYRHVYQYIPVKPNTLYHFMGYMRAQGISTDSGPRFQLYDAYDRSKLYPETENLVGTSTWSPQQLEFRTGPETHLLLLRVTRRPSRKFDNLISGMVWIDRISLNAVE